MPYTPTAWNNDTAPFIEADNLNKIEEELVKQSTTQSYVIPLELSIQGNIKLSKCNNTCHIMGELTTPVTMGGSTIIAYLSDNFTPNSSFTCPVFDTSGYALLGRIYFDSANKTLVLQTSSQGEDQVYFDATFISKE